MENVAAGSFIIIILHERAGNRLQMVAREPAAPTAQHSARSICVTLCGHRPVVSPKWHELWCSLLLCTTVCVSNTRHQSRNTKLKVYMLPDVLGDTCSYHVTYQVAPSFSSCKYFVVCCMEFPLSCFTPTYHKFDISMTKECQNPCLVWQEYKIFAI